MWSWITLPLTQSISIGQTAYNSTINVELAKLKLQHFTYIIVKNKSMKARKQIQPHFEFQTVVLVQLFSTMNTTWEKQIQRQNIHEQI